MGSPPQSNFCPPLPPLAHTQSPVTGQQAWPSMQTGFPNSPGSFPASQHSGHGLNSHLLFGSLPTVEPSGHDLTSSVHGSGGHGGNSQPRFGSRDSTVPSGQ
eukprot:3427689-Rhodomonas_salina.1